MELSLVPSGAVVRKTGAWNSGSYTVAQFVALALLNVNAALS